MSRTVIGVDLGGTKIDAARYNCDSWEVEDKKRIDTRADEGFDSVLSSMIGFIEELKTDSTQAIGIGVPGLVRQPQGVVLQFPNIPGGDGVPLKRNLEDRTGMSVVVDNDANCFTLAEAILGSGKDYHIVVGVTMGTGVGGGIVINQKVFWGTSGFAGEIGHMLLVPGHPPYTTDDQRGEVEQFFSGTAMGKRCEEASNPDDYLEGQVCSFMHKDIFREVAWMCTNLIHLLDPGVIVFGGSAGRALAPHFPQVKEELQHWILPGTPLPDLKLAELPDAATRGAALLTKG